jgi:hypothetical protein
LEKTWKFNCVKNLKSLTLAQDDLAHIYNINENFQPNWKIPEHVSRDGARDISQIIYWIEPVLYLDLVSKFHFPEITEMPGYLI